MKLNFPLRLLAAASLAAASFLAQAADLTVAYQTTAGSATAGADFTATAGTVSFAAGQTSATFSIPIPTLVLENVSVFAVVR